MATQFLSKDVTVNRNEYIGGSDIAAIMGYSRWKTPLRLWCEKTGKLSAPDLSNVEAVEMGTKLEQFVADMFEKDPEFFKYQGLVIFEGRQGNGKTTNFVSTKANNFKTFKPQNDFVPPATPERTFGNKNKTPQRNKSYENKHEDYEDYDDYYYYYEE